MAIEYVPVYDEAGIDVGGYTETVPDMPEQEEPDCYAHNSNSCGCMGDIPPSNATPGMENVTDPWAGMTTGTQEGFSDEPPF